MEHTLYLKMEKAVEVTSETVFLKDISSVLCTNKEIENKVKSIIIYELTKDEIRKVINVLQVIDLIKHNIDNVNIITIGELNVLIEFVKQKKKQPIIELFKIIFVCGICFFGTAFTIMAFHNDIDIENVFSRVHEIVTGEKSSGFSPLEISYSFGLAAGIILFFNHFGGKKITKDPTPVEVEMKKYEEDLNDALIQINGRKGSQEDVE